MKNKRSIGKMYEELALKHLEDKGFILVDKNYFCPFGEIDLILSKKSILYFVEVKYRSSLAYGSPRQAINAKKMERMKKTALHYVKTQSNTFLKFNVSFLGILKVEENIEYDWIENIFS